MPGTFIKLKRSLLTLQEPHNQTLKYELHNYIPTKNNCNGVVTASDAINVVNMALWQTKNYLLVENRRRVNVKLGV